MTCREHAGLKSEMKSKGFRGTLPNPHQEQKLPIFIAICRNLWEGLTLTRLIVNRCFIYCATVQVGQLM